MILRVLQASALMLLAACLPTTRGATVGSPPSATRPSTVPTASFTRVMMERRACFGTCPVYIVNVAGTGQVTFEGKAHTDSSRGSARLTAPQLAELEKAFDDAGYYALDSAYVRGAKGCGAFASDAPTVITSITTPTRSKRVEHNGGCSDAPSSLATLESRIAEITGVARWIGRR